MIYLFEQIERIKRRFWQSKFIKRMIGGSHYRSLRHYFNFCMPILVYGLSISNRRISEIYPAKILKISTKDYSTSNELFQFRLGIIRARISKKLIHNFQINSLCTMFCNFVKESTPSFIKFSRRSTYNEDISLTNADPFSKLISLVARLLFYMFSYFGACISFPALYKNRRVNVFFSSGIFGKGSF